MEYSVLRLVSGSEKTDANILSVKDYYVNYKFCPINYVSTNKLYSGFDRLRTIVKSKFKNEDGTAVKMIDSQPINFTSEKNRSPRLNKDLEGWTEESYLVPDGVIVRLVVNAEERGFGKIAHKTAIYLRTRATGAKTQIRFSKGYGLPYLAIGYFDVLSAEFVKKEEIVDDPRMLHYIGDTLRDQFIGIDILEKAKYDMCETGTRVITVEGKAVEILERKRKRSIKK